MIEALSYIHAGKQFLNGQEPITSQGKPFVLQPPHSRPTNPVYLYSRFG